MENVPDVNIVQNEEIEIKPVILSESNHLNYNHEDQKNFVCEFCDKTFSHPENMNVHMKRIHFTNNHGKYADFHGMNSAFNQPSSDIKQEISNETPIQICSTANPSFEMNSYYDERLLMHPRVMLSSKFQYFDEHQLEKVLVRDDDSIILLYSI